MEMKFGVSDWVMRAGLQNRVYCSYKRLQKKNLKKNMYIYIHTYKIYISVQFTLLSCV